MIEFGKQLVNGVAVKRSFPGATTTQMSHYVMPHLKEEIPDQVIIHVGTNNLSKKSHQSEIDVVNEINEIVNICHREGVNEVFVSSLTCRPKYQHKVEQINYLL